MLANVTAFLLQTVLGLLTFLLLLRFLMQYTRTPFHNPLGQLAVALTDFMVKPTRSLVRAYKQWDLSTLLLAWLVQVILVLALASVAGSMPGVLTVALTALLGVLSGLIDIFFYAILAQAILSWVSPYHPLQSVLDQLSAPVLRPIRRWCPPIQGFDLSSLVALILLQMLGHIVLPGVFAALH